MIPSDQVQAELGGQLLANYLAVLTLETQTIARAAMKAFAADGIAVSVLCLLLQSRPARPPAASGFMQATLMGPVVSMSCPSTLIPGTRRCLKAL